jgi:cation transport ATPase
MNIPVDGYVIKGSGILTNESAMTGEIHEIKKEALEVCL